MGGLGVWMLRVLMVLPSRPSVWLPPLSTFVGLPSGSGSSLAGAGFGTVVRGPIGLGIGIARLEAAVEGDRMLSSSPKLHTLPEASPPAPTQAPPSMVVGCTTQAIPGV